MFLAGHLPQADSHSVHLLHYIPICRTLLHWRCIGPDLQCHAHRQYQNCGRDHSSPEPHEHDSVCTVFSAHKHQHSLAKRCELLGHHCLSSFAGPRAESADCAQYGACYHCYFSGSVGAFEAQRYSIWTHPHLGAVSCTSGPAVCNCHVSAEHCRDCYSGTVMWVCFGAKV